MSRAIGLLFLLLTLIVLTESAVLGQCAMCRTALEQSAEGRALAGSFRHGILVLLAAPYLIFGTVGVVVFRAYRKKAGRKTSEFGFQNSDSGEKPTLYGVPKSRIRNPNSET
jgi:hypothetical protein